MSQLSLKLKKLYQEKKYKEIINIINELDDNNLNSGLLNLLGVCKMLYNNSTETLKSAIQDFREAYLIEKKTKNSLNALKNFINASIDLFDIEFKSSEINSTDNTLKEIFSYINDNKDYLEKNDELTRAFVRALVRNVDIEKVIYYLNQIIKKETSTIDALASYIYYQSFTYNWDQKKFLEHSKILDQKLISYPNDKIVEISGSDRKKINIGFHSADIRSKHSVTHFLKTVLVNYDRNKFSISIYDGNKPDKEDSTMKDFKQYVDKMTNIRNIDDIGVINLVRKDKIDILIDLMGLTSNHRLSLYKNRLAPIQITWCGFQNTTGIKEMDYIIVDKNLIFEDEKKLYSEKILYMEDIWNCHSGFEIPRLQTSAPIFENEFITFGSFNNYNKINDRVIKVWSKILKKVKNSKLILKSSNATFRSAMAEKFRKNDVINSVEFLSYQGNFEDHLNQYRKIDIALDTFPYNGVTTSFEAIWMGVPVLTMKGFNYNSRSGESINKNLNLQELIAENENDYINIAVNLEKNVKNLKKLRDVVFDNALSSPLFDQKKFSNQFFKSLEKLYN
tara:strand:+ start:1376 stop:3064 length:1689 start_codon:yes stop_codon:yes gene_type:complete